MAKLKFLSGPLNGTEHDFDGELVIGRAESDLDIDDPQISRRHLRMSCMTGGVLVQDLDSSNGTFLDDRRLTAVETVRGRAIIRIGQTKFELIGAEVRVDATQVASADPNRTRISEGPPATSEHTAVATPPPREAATAPTPPPSSPPAPPAQAAPVGAYAPIAPPRPRRGPATRLLAPAALTALIIVAVAVALVIYFATR
jgi:predicted component of type VI protein secretion system